MTPTLHVLDSKVVITVRGEGEPVLFLHGNPDTKEVWDGALCASARGESPAGVDGLVTYGKTPPAHA